MTHYIDKDAIVTEIERQIKLFGSENYKCSDRLTVEERLFTLNSIKEFIDTLEVKEVNSLTSEEIKKICTIYDNLNQERECATVLYNSDETFFNHVLMEYKSIAQKGE
jgi:hypothetical protein